MTPSDTAFIHCPYCGERIEIVVDASVEFQEYVEDCGVCCRPIEFTVRAEDSIVMSIDARSEDE